MNVYPTKHWNAAKAGLAVSLYVGYQGLKAGWKTYKANLNKPKSKLHNPTADHPESTSHPAPVADTES